MATGETWALGRQPALDGLRGIACALVVIAHSWVPGFELAGAVGVAMFFTLSGFLITSLLLEERGRSGHIRLAAFYARRARRLLPALIACVVVVAALGLAAPVEVAASLTYMSNWLSVAEGSTGALAHTWSLAVEEQFYLTWPLLVVVLAGRVRTLLTIAFVGIAASLALRIAWWDGGEGLDRIHYGFDTSADALLIGCALALLMHQSGRRAARPMVAAVTLAGAVLVCLCGAWAMFVPGPTIVAALTAAAIFAIVHDGEVQWLQRPWLLLIGRRSYGLYLWHFPVAALLWEQDWLTRLVVISVVGWGLALLSWRFIELPFLRQQPFASPPDGHAQRTPLAANHCAADGSHRRAVPLV